MYIIAQVDTMIYLVFREDEKICDICSTLEVSWYVKDIFRLVDINRYYD